MFVLDAEPPQGCNFPLAQLEMRFLADSHQSCDRCPHPSKGHCFLFRWINLLLRFGVPLETKISWTEWSPHIFKVIAYNKKILVNSLFT